MPTIKLRLFPRTKPPLFCDLVDRPDCLLAVSGGPDSTALLWLAARWREIAQAKAEAHRRRPSITDCARSRSAKPLLSRKLAKKLGVPHRDFEVDRPEAEVRHPAERAQGALRAARRRRARSAGAAHILTAHTLDDQAETVLMRMARGSGIGGLGGMARRSRLDGLALVRPFLDIPKARLVATLKAAKIAYAEDPSNIDPKFTRARLRPLMARWSAEASMPGAWRCWRARLRRADAAIEAATERRSQRCQRRCRSRAPSTLPAASFARLPAEDRAARARPRRAQRGDRRAGRTRQAGGAARRGRLRGPEAGKRRRSGAPWPGALVRRPAGEKISVEAAPARKKPPAVSPLTKRGRRNPRETAAKRGKIGRFQRSWPLAAVCCRAYIGSGRR